MLPRFTPQSVAILDNTITEKTDAIAIVVSEEDGKISFIKNGEIFKYSNDENLIAMIEAERV